MSDHFISCCPECHEEALEVTVTDSGKGFDPEYGEIYWFSGSASCGACGFITNDYSDQSV